MSKRTLVTVIVVAVMLSVMCGVVICSIIKRGKADERAEKYVQKLQSGVVEDTDSDSSADTESENALLEEEESSESAGVFVYGVEIDSVVPLYDSDVSELPELSLEDLPEWAQQEVALRFVSMESISMCYATAKQYYGEDVTFEYSDKLATHVFNGCYNNIYCVNGVVLDFVITDDESHIYMFERGKVD